MPGFDTAPFQSLYAQGKHDSEIADACGCSRDTVRRWRSKEGLPPNVIGSRRVSPDVPVKPFEIDELPDAAPSASELLVRRKHDFARKSKAKLARKLIGVNVNITGPIGIAHFGDPHVDDDGTDLSMLERHVNIVNATEGMFAGNVGDYSNNWVGRIAHLYGQQSTSAQEAWVLVEWLIRACDWLYLLGGNHDAWSGEGDPVKWIARQQGSLLQPNGARLGLRFPNGRVCRINARHNWPGHSMWNSSHGVARAAQMGHADHVLTCGHTHVSGYQVIKQPVDGLISHCLQVASYKIFDRYAEEKALKDQAIFNCPVTIIQPQYADDDPRYVTFIPDPETGADFLTFLRRRKAA